VNPLFRAAAELQHFCASRGWRSAIIGGLAVQRWGEPRQTRDVDLSLLAPLGEEAAIIDALLQQFRPRREDARQFAIDRRVLLVEISAGVPADISLSALPYEERVVDRATGFPVSHETAIVTCSAEDLVVLKAFADRPRDWIDIEGVIVRRGRLLDRALVLAELLPLLELKEDDTPQHRLTRLFRTHD
jgi:hypothetical protein